MSNQPPLTLVFAGNADLTVEAVHDNIKDLVGLLPFDDDGGPTAQILLRQTHPILVLTHRSSVGSLRLVMEWFRWVGVGFTLVVNEALTQDPGAEDFVRAADNTHYSKSEGHALAKVILLIQSSQRAGREAQIVGIGGVESDLVYELARWAEHQGIVARDLSRGMHPIVITIPKEDKQLGIEIEQGEEDAPVPEVVPARRRRAQQPVEDEPAPARRTRRAVSTKPRPLVIDETAEDEPQPHQEIRVISEVTTAEGVTFRALGRDATPEELEMERASRAAEKDKQGKKMDKETILAMLHALVEIVEASV